MTGHARGHAGHMPPGQVQKHTGYNPASGKYHPKKAGHAGPKIVIIATD